MSTALQSSGGWTSLRRYEHSGRVLDCVAVAQPLIDRRFLSDGLAELVASIQQIVNAPRSPEHAGAVVLFGLEDTPSSRLALAAVRGFTISVAQELAPRLRLNLIVHEAGSVDLEPTLSFLADPLSAYVLAATIPLGDVQL